MSESNASEFLDEMRKKFDSIDRSTLTNSQIRSAEKAKRNLDKIGTHYTKVFGDEHANHSIVTSESRARIPRNSPYRRPNTSRHIDPSCYRPNAINSTGSRYSPLDRDSVRSYYESETYGPSTTGQIQYFRQPPPVRAPIIGSDSKMYIHNY